MKISASIIVYNEEENIADLCETLEWADEIVIVDSGSTDRTAEFAKKYTDKVFQHEFKGYKDKHQFADAQTTGDWIFWIDADERVTPELKESISRLRMQDENALPDGFRIARKTFYLGRWIRFCGWYPDYQMRLYRKSKSFWDGVSPHETARVEGKIETLAGELLHYTKRDLSDHHRVIERYASLAAEYKVEHGEKTGAVAIFFGPVGAFLRTYILKQGFRDGTRGLIISMFTAYGVFLKTAKVWERNNTSE
ncbi:MAG TPA: glycosyltransferase family 2 protein [Pyrinomonadaceae bacterium]|nr:glycosyltransferase family 2 protein [Pyrinomonadaceae bacterium]